MKIFKVAAAVGLAVALGAGLTACGPGYTGEGVVKDKGTASTSKAGSKVKTTKYKITVDVPNTDVHQVVTVQKNQYDNIQVGQNVKVEDGKIK